MVIGGAPWRERAEVSVASGSLEKKPPRPALSKQIHPAPHIAESSFSSAVVPAHFRLPGKRWRHHRSWHIQRHVDSFAQLHPHQQLKPKVVHRWWFGDSDLVNPCDEDRWWAAVDSNHLPHR